MNPELYIWLSPFWNVYDLLGNLCDFCAETPARLAGGERSDLAASPLVLAAQHSPFLVRGDFWAAATRGPTKDGQKFDRPDLGNFDPKQESNRPPTL